VKIAVCIKRVPDMDVRFKIAADGTSLDETGVKFDLNDFDAWAVEAALQLKEKAGSGEVTVLSLGPQAVQETLRKALSMGADKAIHLQADKFPFDGFAIATALAAELKAGSYDVILFGKLSPDSSNGVTGTIVAEMLDMPCVTAISRLDIADG
jgi:electron transfer flavoprotein beta subunit